MTTGTKRGRFMVSKIKGELRTPITSRSATDMVKALEAHASAVDQVTEALKVAGLAAVVDISEAVDAIREVDDG